MDISSLILIILLVAACVTSFTLLVRARNRATKAETEASMLRQNLDFQRNSQEEIISHLKESHTQEIQSMQQQFEQSRQDLLQQHEAAKADMQRQHEAAKADMQRQWEEKLQMLKLEFSKLSTEHLHLQQESMKQTNRESVEGLLNPLRQTIDTFKREFVDKMTEQGKTDAVMQDAIRRLREQTDILGSNADKLTRALKADPKKQGDWGEEILRNILEASGMTEGREFVTQARTIDAEGHTDIPDVLVRIPGEGSIIIDSKTSIKHYLDYTASDNEAERTTLIKEHIRSVRKHVQELAEKHYPKKVKDAAAYVLMFIPNDGSYILAMENDARLAIDAYREHIIIVNPTTLMLALQIVSQLWKSQQQSENVRSIIDSATKIYEKFTTFTQSFVTIESRIQSLTTAYKEARTQLTDGRGNLVHQLDSFRQKGVITSKLINEKLLEEATDEAPTDDETSAKS